MNNSIYRVMLIFVVLLISSSVALAIIQSDLADQGRGVKDRSSGNLLATGDLSVEIWDSPTGGNIIYNETFANAISNGSWDVLLGDNGAIPLYLQFNKKYYKDYKINGEDVSFTNSTGRTMDRQPFYSPLGGINSTDTILNTMSNTAGLANYAFYSLSQNPGYALRDTGSITGWSITAGSSGQLQFNIENDTNPISTAVVITNDGNVGIRTTSPHSTLEVNGSGIMSSSPQNSGGFFIANSSGIMRWAIRGTNNETGSNMGDDLAIIARSDDGSSLATDLFINRSNGNIGMGTATPATKLSVLSLDNTNNAAVPLILVGSDRQDYRASIDSVRGVDSTHLGMAFSTSNGISPAEAMRIQPSGYVGIGTSTPVAPLQVGDTSSGTPYYDTDYYGLFLDGIGLFNKNQTANPYQSELAGDISSVSIIGNQYFTGGWHLFDPNRAPAQISLVSYDNNSYIFFGTKNVSTAGTVEAMRIDGNGSVGIGTTNPTQKLDVNGNINALNYSAGGSMGITKTISVNGTAGTCTITITGGLITGTSC